jgi:hypothetical protein
LSQKSLLGWKQPIQFSYAVLSFSVSPTEFRLVEIIRPFSILRLFNGFPQFN